MDTRTKIICIKERVGSFYKLDVGVIYYMSLREQVHSIGGQISRKIVGYDIFRNEHDKSWFNVNPDTFHSYFITFDQRRQDKLNSILDGYQD